MFLWRLIQRFILTVVRDPISMVGLALTTSSTVLIVGFFVVELLGFHAGPYIGILTFVVFPMFFAAGLILIPIGVLRERKRMRLAGEVLDAGPFPILDLNNKKIRRVLWIFAGITAVNVVFFAAASYQGVEVMGSTEFCGTTCHTVMQPEYTAYLGSPHAKVKCVECHIGPGANWFVKSKITGSWQLIAVTFNLYPTPIPSPIKNLRPARETCEQCHWPTKFIGDRLKVITHYKENEANTETKTVLLLRVGGIEGRKSQGIHWHVDPKNQIRYRANQKRDTIYSVEYKKADGTIEEFFEGGKKPGENKDMAEWRTMDCLDCHNRPSHTFRPAHDEIDRAILGGRIDRSLPFVRREGLALIKANYASHMDARKEMVAKLLDFYSKNYPDLVKTKREAIQEAATTLGDIYEHNIFPAMKVTWGTYANHIGHENYPGCFRCHDGNHKTADGRTISDDCDTCHTLLAQEEENPKILSDLQP